MTWAENPSWVHAEFTRSTRWAAVMHQRKYSPKNNISALKQQTTENWIIKNISNTVQWCHDVRMTITLHTAPLRVKSTNIDELMYLTCFLLLVDNKRCVNSRSSGSEGCTVIGCEIRRVTVRIMRRSTLCWVSLKLSVWCPLCFCQPVICKYLTTANRKLT